jgi:alpha-ketoglutarate-dependent taurine dioxygenase
MGRQDSRPTAGSRRPVPVNGSPRSESPRTGDRGPDGTDEGVPALFTSAPDTGADWPAWYAERRGTLTDTLRTRGAILFRNTPVSTVDEFRRFCQALTPSLMNYVERSSPRRELADQVYTSTEYPADENIFLHNECAYSRTWPQALFFYGDRPAVSGGETTLCDSRQVYARLSAGLKRRFEHGVIYARHYSGFLDLTWETAFQTTDKHAVERYCREAGIEWNWTASGGLKTRQVGQAMCRHPETGEDVWFNQAHMFHISALKDDYRTALLGMFAEADLPRQAYMADGSPIDAADLNEIRAAYESLQCAVRLERGDILWVDNVLCAHGRRPFIGERRIAVVMTDPMHASA